LGENAQDRHAECPQQVLKPHDATRFQLPWTAERNAFVRLKIMS
jgi:hypothetical protein